MPCTLLGWTLWVWVSYEGGDSDNGGGNGNDTNGGGNDESGIGGGGNDNGGNGSSGGDNKKCHCQM